MEQMIITPIAKSLNISEKQVVNTLDLLEQGNTVPFIARYRKEVTNGLDAVSYTHLDVYKRQGKDSGNQ